IAHSAILELARYVDRPLKRLAVVMPDTPLRAELLASLDSEVHVEVASSAAEAREALPDADAVVVDDSVADFGPEDLLDAVAERTGICQLPVIVWRGAGKDQKPGDGPSRQLWNREQAGFGQREAATPEA